jgi:hypothetical protein
MAIGGIFMYMGVTEVEFRAGGEKYSMQTPGIAVGSVFLVGGTVFSIARSILYSKPRPQNAVSSELSFWDFAVMPGINGVEQINFSYTMRF